MIGDDAAFLGQLPAGGDSHGVISWNFVWQMKQETAVIAFHMVQALHYFSVSLSAPTPIDTPILLSFVPWFTIP